MYMSFPHRKWYNFIFNNIFWHRYPIELPSKSNNACMDPSSKVVLTVVEQHDWPRWHTHRYSGNTRWMFYFIISCSFSSSQRSVCLLACPLFCFSVWHWSLAEHDSLLLSSPLLSSALPSSAVTALNIYLLKHYLLVLHAASALCVWVHQICTNTALLNISCENL